MPRKKAKKTGAKRKRQAGGRRQMLRGDGFFGDIGNWFKRAGETVYKKAIRPAYDFAKDNKLVSRGLGAASLFLPGAIGTAAKVGAAASGLAGYGRGRMKGGARTYSGERMFGTALSN